MKTQIALLQEAFVAKMAQRDIHSVSFGHALSQAELVLIQGLVDLGLTYREAFDIQDAASEALYVRMEVGA